MAITDNLISYWKLDETSGNASDSQGSNTLTNSNVTYSVGVKENCAIFNGTDARLVAGDYIYDPEAPFAISFWIYAPTAIATREGVGGLVFRGNSDETSHTGAQIYIDYSIRYSHRNSGDQIIITSPIPANTWTHVAISKSGSGTTGTVSIYINGVLNTSGTITNFNTQTSNNVTLGRLGDSTLAKYHFEGRLDEVYIWSRELTQQDVNFLYTGSESGAQTGALLFF